MGEGRFTFAFSIAADQNACCSNPYPSRHFKDIHYVDGRHDIGRNKITLSSPRLYYGTHFHELGSCSLVILVGNCELCIIIRIE